MDELKDTVRPTVDAYLRTLSAEEVKQYLWELSQCQLNVICSGCGLKGHLQSHILCPINRIYHRMIRSVPISSESTNSFSLPAAAISTAPMLAGKEYFRESSHPIPFWHQR